MDVLAVDPPGWNGVLPAHRSLDFLVDAVLHVLDSHSVRQVNVLGVSYGSLFALSLAQRHPSRVSRLVLNAVPARLSSAVQARMRLALSQLLLLRYLTGHNGEHAAQGVCQHLAAALSSAGIAGRAWCAYRCYW